MTARGTDPVSDASTGRLTLDRGTLRSGAIGGLLAVVVGFVPLLGLGAPLLGGGVAGYVDRRGPTRGAVAGAVAGLLASVVGTVLSFATMSVRFGLESGLGLAGPGQGFPVRTLVFAFLVGGFFTLVAAVGTTVVAAVGGYLGGTLEEDRSRRHTEREVADALPGAMTRTRRVAAAAAALVGGIVTFGVVGLGVTAVLDPYIWPSALVGIPVGLVAGAAVAVLGYHVLTTRRFRRDRRGGANAQ